MERTKQTGIRNKRMLFWVLFILVVFLDETLARVLVVDHASLEEDKAASGHRKHDTDWTNVMSDKDKDHLEPNDTMTQTGPMSRVGRQKRAVDASGAAAIPKHSRDVAMFGFSVRFDNEKKRVTYTEEGVQIFEGLDVTLVFYGRFIKGTKVRLNDNGHKCDKSLDEKAIELKLDLAGDKSAPPGYVYTTATADMTMKTVKGFKKVYFCLLNPTYKKWEAQGESPSVLVELTGRLMPLYLHILLIAALLLLSGLFSGLNLGLMSLNKTDLKIIINTGTPVEQKHARKIAPVRNHGNFLLCCLLFSNVLVNASLTIIMDDITSGIWAIVVSTMVIVIFGEIVPQAICSRHGLAVGATTILLTKFFMVLTFVLAYPLSVLLDRLLGEEIGNVYTRERLKELLRITKDHHGLENEEVAVISGALDMKTKTVKDIMTKIDNVFMLPLEAKLDYETVSEIEDHGYTRIPIYDREKFNTVAVLNVKQLTLLDASDNIPIRTVIQYYQNSMLYVFENTRLDYMFRAFREGNRGHMAFVQKVNDEGPSDPFYETVGVVTMEDVLEELLQADILDETDIGKCRTRLDRRSKKTKEIPFMLNKRLLPAIDVPPPLALATCQFLTTGVPAFKRTVVSENILKRLVKTRVTVVRPHKGRPRGLYDRNYLYEMGKPADYFIMILEGRVHVEVGAEKIVFIAGPFQYFGAEFLLSKPSHENIADFKNPPSPGSKVGLRKYTFTPDYTAYALTETFYMKVTFAAYRAACHATALESKYSKDPRARAMNANWEQEVEEILSLADEDVNLPQRRINYTEDEQSNEEVDRKGECTQPTSAAKADTKETGTGRHRAEVPTTSCVPGTSANVPSVPVPGPSRIIRKKSTENSEPRAGPSSALRRKSVDTDSNTGRYNTDEPSTSAKAMSKLPSPQSMPPKTPSTGRANADEPSTSASVTKKSPPPQSTPPKNMDDKDKN